jgi:multidrug efflux pump subunit AcrA (membrane-fusion protein)
MFGCKGNNNVNANQQVITVASHPIAKSLYFNGFIKPMNAVDVTATVGGIVDKRYFTYGQTVKKNDPLLELASSKFMSDYQQAFVQYIKAKDEYYNAKTKFIGTQDLWANKLISRNEYESQESQLAGSYLAYLQARGNFQTLTGKEVNEQFTLKDTQAVKEALAHLANAMVITAPTSGIVLYPPKKSEGGDEDSAVDVGSEIKAGQNLLAIGNMTGIAIDIQVGEIDIDKIKVGQEVQVSSLSFPEPLKGHVATVGSQAKVTSGGSGNPTFSVRVTVPQLTEQQRKYVRVGMSAKVTIELAYPPNILIPIKAVHERNGKTVVDRVDKKSGKVKEVVVEVGETTPNDVEITNGLKVGDEIVVNN